MLGTDSEPHSGQMSHIGLILLGNVVFNVINWTKLIFFTIVSTHEKLNYRI